ncbi:SAM-dependent methyltransferase [Nocardia sp. NPDC005745]|uniref:SAM-dependent methyltransferase n=1 Tax=Nocardia sp. NPDC005745 TaxID=3157061 RepID=UPI0033F10980
MTEETAKAPVRGAAMTAIGVAMIRARESERPDRLYDDPWAKQFVAAARSDFEPERWARLEMLAEQFYAGRSLGVRLVDDRVREAIDAGCRQIVLLGAGLDTRAFRLGLPESIHAFEIDLPGLFAFKESVLARAGSTATCRRQVIAMDLAEDWATALRKNGFRPDIPTYWVDEGALAYMPPEQNRRVVLTLTELSCRGSRFGVSRFRVDATAGPYPELRRLVSGDAAPPRAPGGLGDDVEQWLDEIGWDTEFRSWSDMVAPLGRPVAELDPDVGNIAAIRR